MRCSIQKLFRLGVAALIGMALFGCHDGSGVPGEGGSPGTAGTPGAEGALGAQQSSASSTEEHFTVTVTEGRESSETASAPLSSKPSAPAKIAAEEKKSQREIVVTERDGLSLPPPPKTADKRPVKRDKDATAEKPVTTKPPAKVEPPVLTEKPAVAKKKECVPKRWFQDADGDGFGDQLVTQMACEKPSGYAEKNSDCDDNNSSVFPGAAELCDKVDNNCDGKTDEAAECQAVAKAEPSTKEPAEKSPAATEPEKPAAAEKSATEKPVAAEPVKSDAGSIAGKIDSAGTPVASTPRFVDCDKDGAEDKWVADHDADGVPTLVEIDVTKTDPCDPASKETVTYHWPDGTKVEEGSAGDGTLEKPFVGLQGLGKHNVLFEGKYEFTDVKRLRGGEYGLHGGFAKDFLSRSFGTSVIAPAEGYSQEGFFIVEGGENAQAIFSGLHLKGNFDSQSSSLIRVFRPAGSENFKMIVTNSILEGAFNGIHWNASGKPPRSRNHFLLVAHSLFKTKIGLFMERESHIKQVISVAPALVNNLFRTAIGFRTVGYDVATQPIPNMINNIFVGSEEAGEVGYQNPGGSIRRGNSLFIDIETPDTQDAASGAWNVPLEEVFQEATGEDPNLFCGKAYKNFCVVAERGEKKYSFLPVSESEHVIGKGLSPKAPGNMVQELLQFLPAYDLIGNSISAEAPSIGPAEKATPPETAAAKETKELEPADILIHLDFEEGIQNLSRYEYKIQMTGEPEVATDEAGGKVLHLDGVDDRVRFDFSDPELFPQPAGTYSVWLKLEAIPTGTVDIMQYVSGGQSKLLMRFAKPAPTFGLEGMRSLFYLRRAQKNPEGEETHSTAIFAGLKFSRDEAGKLKWEKIWDGNFETGKWIHLVSVYDGEGLRHYVDGRVVAQFSDFKTYGTALSEDMTFFIGGLSGGTEEQIKGFVDNVRVYNRMLSEEEIGKLFEEKPGKEKARNKE